VAPLKVGPRRPSGRERRRGQHRPHVLVIVQNLPVPLDRRVWLECQTLTAAGYEVSVICPKGPGDPSYQVLEGVHLYKYRPSMTASGLAGFLLEFTYSWLRTARLSSKVWRRAPFQVMQACNPPDTYWLLARLWKALGVKFVFDQHDLNPELYLSRFGEPTTRGERLQYWGLCWLERMTYRTAAMVISTNESYRAVAMTRGHRAGEDVVVVRSGPDTTVMRPVHVERQTGPEDMKTLVYLGVMGPQDGVDVVLAVMHDLVHKRGRRDVRAVLMGFGDCYEDLRRRTTELGLDPWVVFTGRADLDTIADQLSSADIGICPDLKSPLNDVSTMNKTMEYMAYALPAVAFDLTETRVSGGDCVLYVPSGDVLSFADSIAKLLDDDQLRCEMGREARRRVESQLDWRTQRGSYVGVFDRVTGTTAGPRVVPLGSEAVAAGQRAGVDHRGRRYVDLTDVTALDRFITQRSHT
jgi:glycosyltransferase involved in cell wall biosynthesis